jgi:glutaredoxin 3
MRRILLVLLALIGLFAAGAFAGYGGSMLVAHLNAPQPVLKADHRALLAQADADILLFSLSTCPYCKQAREWLQSKQLPYKELVIDQSDEAKRIFDQLDEPALPVLVTGDRLVRGFSAAAYEQAAANFRAEASVVER